MPGIRQSGVVKMGRKPMFECHYNVSGWTNSRLAP